MTFKGTAEFAPLVQRTDLVSYKITRSPLPLILTIICFVFAFVGLFIFMSGMAEVGVGTGNAATGVVTAAGFSIAVVSMFYPALNMQRVMFGDVTLTYLPTGETMREPISGRLRINKPEQITALAQAFATGDPRNYTPLKWDAWMGTTMLRVFDAPQARVAIVVIGRGKANHPRSIAAEPVILQGPAYETLISRSKAELARPATGPAPAATTA